MQKRFLNILLPVFAAALITGSCTSVRTESYDANDLSYLYNPLRNVIHPMYRVFHEDDNTSILSVKLRSGDLFFSEANPQGVPRAEMVLFYRLFNLSQGRVVTDTALVNIPIVRSDGRVDYIFSFPIEAEAGYNYEVDILLRDQLRNITVQTLLPFDKSTENSGDEY